MKLLGRADECALLDKLVDDLSRGESRSMVLRGAAGVGKTALLQYLIESAAELNVVRAVGVESEMELSFASLHQLCAPLLDRLGRLPEPQRDALRIVFGLSAGPPPDRFLVGLAVLSLVSEVDERPLLCIVDDAQWLDQASALTLAFVARRLLAEPVGFVFAAREPGENLRHFPVLEVHGLADGDARAMLNSTLRFAMDKPVFDRVVAEARGNPLALKELPRSLTPAQLAGGFAEPDVSDLSIRIEQSYTRRLHDLPDAARRLLLVAAAEPVGDPLLVRRASERLGIAFLEFVDVDATDGLLSIDERVRFEHPLVRSAVYRSATRTERRTTHLALAEATNRDVDPDRRAWHLAAAATGPDEHIAVELELSARWARARGGLSASAALLQRAVAMTGDPTRHAARALTAAEANLGVGAFGVARGLLAAAEAGPLDDLGRARVDLLRAEVAFAQNRGGDAPPLLLKAAGQLESIDPGLALDTYLEAWGAALFAGDSTRTGGLPDVSRAASNAPPRPGPAVPRDLLLQGLALIFTAGRSAAAPTLRRGVAAFTGPDVSSTEMVRWGWLATRAANFLWDYDSGLEIGKRAVQLARDSGLLEVLAVVDNACGQAAAFGGDFASAGVLVAEVDAVKEATGTRIPPHAGIALAALRGQESDAAELFDGIIVDATASGQGTAIQYAHWAKSVLMNGLGRYEDALAAAVVAANSTPELYIASWALSEQVEAATRTDNADLALSALIKLAEHTETCEADWGLGLLARSRALVSASDAAEPLYQEAITRLGRTRLRPELARAHLLYGEWLRRENRRVDARSELRVAHDLMVTIGMKAFAERAQSELLATGERVRQRTAESHDELTPQELQIARLARGGLSNPEIGARLFLSPRTVEWHLRKVFVKLRIRSRQELARALPSAESELVPA
jgi:DNA-binding CsgD family transcriptional regulator/tetratricopeptide (TPR) repeat protein